MRRFYTQVSITPERGILLDARPVKTPMRRVLQLPNDAFAHAVAAEWREQGEQVDPRVMPMTGLANVALDHVGPDPAAFAAGIAVYGETELLCYRAAEPPALVDHQRAHWDPLLDWARTRYDIGFTLVEGIIHQPQPETTLARLGAAVAARQPFELAALAPLIQIGGSLVIALALLEGQIDAESAFATAHLDELWQAEQWGEDDFALEARAVHHRDFLAAARFLALV